MSQETTAQAPANLVKVTQLPVIEDQLRSLRSWVEKTVSGVDAMVCNEDTLLEVKSFRTDLNNLFKELEVRRKDVLTEVEAPIKQFNATYKECVSDYFKKADNTLREKIVSVESAMKGATEQLLRNYFDELTEAQGISFLKFEETGVVVSMADARAKTQPPKKLCEQVEKFVLRVGQDVDTILTMENADEILSIYKTTLNLTNAISVVNERHRQIAEAKAEQDRRNAVKVQEAETVRKFEAFAPPVVSEPAPPQAATLTVRFAVTDTRERLKLLKQYLDANGYKYT